MRRVERRADLGDDPRRGGRVQPVALDDRSVEVDPVDVAPSQETARLPRCRPRTAGPGAGARSAPPAVLRARSAPGTWRSGRARREPASARPERRRTGAAPRTRRPSPPSRRAARSGRRRMSSSAPARPPFESHHIPRANKLAPVEVSDSPVTRDGEPWLHRCFTPAGASPLDDELTLGRSDDNDVVIADERASRHHARISRSDGGFVIEDLGSRHGTFLNGERLAGESRAAGTRGRDRDRRSDAALPRRPGDADGVARAAGDRRSRRSPSRAIA